MIGTLPYVFGALESHSKFTEEMHTTLRPMPKMTVFVVDVSIDWTVGRNWQTKVLASGKVPQLTLPRQKSVNWGFPGKILALWGPVFPLVA